MGYPQFPTFEKPEIPERISELERLGVINQSYNFLNGKYDPNAAMFSSYWDAFDNANAKGTKTMIDDIIARQGGQRIYGGAAGQQVRETLLDKDKNDILNRREMLMNMINTIIGNRQFGVGVAQDAVNSAKSYETNVAGMKNSYNQSMYDASLGQYMYRKADANTTKNWLPAITQGAQAAAQIGTSMYMAGGVGAGATSRLGQINQYSGQPAKYSTMLPAAAYGGY